MSRLPPLPLPVGDAPPPPRTFKDCVYSYSGGKEQKDKAATQTLIFVDVDGVLNVTVADPGQQAIEFSTTNLKRAKAKRAKLNAMDSCEPGKRLTVDRVLATSEFVLGHGENSTFKKLIANPDTKLSDILVGRLAQLIRAAGRNVQVVLTSSWRESEDRVRKLEMAIGLHLGEVFEFDARTPLRHLGSAQQRLQCVAEFARAHCQKQLSSGGQLRIIILDDLNITALDALSCGDRALHSTKAIEDYLLSWIPNKVLASAKLVHTYCEWMEPEGLQVRVGCGLTKEKLCQALTFLGAQCKLCAQFSADRPPLPPLRLRAGESLVSGSDVSKDKRSLSSRGMTLASYDVSSQQPICQGPSVENPSHGQPAAPKPDSSILRLGVDTPRGTSSYRVAKLMSGRGIAMKMQPAFARADLAILNDAEGLPAAAA